MNVLQYLMSLRPAVPMSVEKPCTETSNSELRRWIKDGSVTLNGERWDANDELPPLIYSLVFFPKSHKRRTTLV
jgi:hypothetical protein